MRVKQQCNVKVNVTMHLSMQGLKSRKTRLCYRKVTYLCLINICVID